MMTIKKADDLEPGDVFVAPSALFGEVVEWTTLGGGIRLVKTDKREIEDLVHFNGDDLVNVKGR